MQCIIEKNKRILLCLAVSVCALIGIVIYIACKTVSCPEFSMESGFYSDNFELEITAPKGTFIFYTLDGSDPDEASIRYDGPIMISDATANNNKWCAREDLTVEKYTIPDRNVEKCTIIRAIAINRFGKQSSVAAATYFVTSELWDHNYPMNFPVVSITTDPALLFDRDKGALVLGERFEEFCEENTLPEVMNDLNIETNYNALWSVPVCFTYFENGRQQYSQQVDIKKQGANSTRGAQKPMDVRANKEYGSETFDYDILGNGRHPKDFLLKRYFRENYDCFLTDTASDTSDSTILPRAHKPVMLFINGECWGCYVIFEKLSKNYFEDHFHLKENELLVLKDGSPYVGGEQAKQEMDEIEAFVASHDMTRDENYQWVCDRIDIDNFIDYYCRTAYYDNDDVGIYSNTYQWKTKVPMNVPRTEAGNNTFDNPDLLNGKWHWTIIDLNATIRDVSRNYMTNGKVDDDPALFAHPILYYLLSNSEFRYKFCVRMIELMDDEYAPEKICDAYQQVCDYMEDATVYTVKRFEQGSYTFWDYEGKVEEVQQFWQNRAGYMRVWMRDIFPDILQ